MEHVRVSAGEQRLVQKVSVHTLSLVTMKRPQVESVESSARIQHVACLLEETTRKILLKRADGDPAYASNIQRGGARTSTEQREAPGTFQSHQARGGGLNNKNQNSADMGFVFVPWTGLVQGRAT